MATTAAIKIILLRDLPSERWFSMDRYAESLAAALQSVAPECYQISMPLPPDQWRSTYGQLVGRLLRYPLWARSLRADLFHIVDHSYAHLLLALDPVRTIVTVHDLAPLHFRGKRLGLSTLAWNAAWRGLQRAQHVIVDSQFIARELQTVLRLPPECVHHVPLAVSEQFAPMPASAVAALRAQYLGGADFLVLHVGSTQPRKNLPTLLMAVAQLRARRLRVRLLQIGGQPTATLRRLIEQAQLGEHVTFAGAVPEELLPAYYNAADLFIFPSLYEGFGLPILEAMACGTPVVASNATSLPAVVGEAGLLVEPLNTDALAEQIACLLHDESLLHDLRERGLQRARSFTWERSAQAAMSAYESMIASAP